MDAQIYIRENDKTLPDFSVVMKLHTRKSGIKARLAGGQLNPASIKRLREAGHRTLYISIKHDFKGYCDHLVKCGYRHYGHVKDFVENIPAEVAEVLESLYEKYKNPVVLKPARWFNNLQ